MSVNKLHEYPVKYLDNDVAEVLYIMHSQMDLYILIRI